MGDQGNPQPGVLCNELSKPRGHLRGGVSRLYAEGGQVKLRVHGRRSSLIPAAKSGGGVTEAASKKVPARESQERASPWQSMAHTYPAPHRRGPFQSRQKGIHGPREAACRSCETSRCSTSSTRCKRGTSYDGEWRPAASASKSGVVRRAIWSARLTVSPATLGCPTTPCLSCSVPPSLTVWVHCGLCRRREGTIDPLAPPQLWTREPWRAWLRSS